MDFCFLKYIVFSHLLLWYYKVTIVL
jgi:hypothetical protein